MRYLIDGYNLVFRVLPHYIPLHHRRRLTIEELSEKISILSLDVAIIFDAHHTLDDSSKGHLANLEIHYTRHQQTADEWIIDDIADSKTPTKITVVTSDNQLAWQCRLNGALVVDVQTFLLWLEKRYDSKMGKESPHTYTPNPVKKPVTTLVTPPVPEKKEKKKEKKPVSSVLPDECIEYYLEAFSKNLPTEEPLPQTLPKLKKAPALPKEEIPKGKKVEENMLDHYEDIFRRRFEKGVEDDGDGA